jgi:hypothetical protein
MLQAGRICGWGDPSRHIDPMIFHNPSGEPAAAEPGENRQ